MDKSILVRIFGFPATLIHGDTLVVDRWLWLKRRLPVTANGETLLDIGCGTGAFSIGAAKRGYKAVGLSWDERNQNEANKRARICGANASFQVCDVRELHLFENFKSRFDVAICLENIEHILDDRKLMIDIAACLKPGGRLLLTTPNFYFRAITKEENGPFDKAGRGGHVRRGYTPTMLRELNESAGLLCEEVSYCSGFFSQKTTALLRHAGKLHPAIGWLLVLPLRPLAVFLDSLSQHWSNFPLFSICMVAQKPRFPSV
ncbi:MAG TPA: methyltransferase domain-containing protein [Methylocella sp.]|nr:methyltransferase domain-containing protein [Methylocella sp.]